MTLIVSKVAFLDNGPYSFSVEAGECVGLSGPSGVGKTQLLRSIIDLLPHSGIIRHNGNASGSMTAPEWRRMVAMVPADPHWWHDTVRAHFTDEGVDGQLLEMMDELGFSDDALKWRVHRLSTGERQRLALIRALMLQPEVLLLDEPSSALDAGHTDRLESMVREYRLAHKAAVIWVSHDREQLRRVADRFLKIERNELITSTSP